MFNRCSITLCIKFSFIASVCCHSISSFLHFWLFSTIEEGNKMKNKIRKVTRKRKRKIWNTLNSDASSTAFLSLENSWALQVDKWNFAKGRNMSKNPRSLDSKSKFSKPREIITRWTNIWRNEFFDGGDIYGAAVWEIPSGVGVIRGNVLLAAAKLH